MPGTPAMAFIAPLVWSSYNKTCIPLPAALPRKVAFQCWESTSFSSDSMGQRSETCPGCAGGPSACSAYCGTPQPTAKDLLLFRDVCTHPVQSVRAGDWTKAADPGPSVSRYTLPNGNGSPAALEVTPAPVTALVSGDERKGWLL